MKFMQMGLFVAATAMVGCSSTNDEDRVQSAAASAPTETPAETTATPKSRAIAAKEALFQKLSTRLMQAMSNGGPAAAIDACSKDAQQIAAEVSDEHQLQIGRTSFKLRNPKNTPPAWAVDMVAARVEEPQFVELADGEFGALLPIKLKAQCIGCHGPIDQLDESVQKMLTELYPDDQATGFNTEELRGWFWVQVPATAKTL